MKSLSSTLPSFITTTIFQMASQTTPAKRSSVMPQCKLSKDHKHIKIRYSFCCHDSSEGLLRMTFSKLLTLTLEYAPPTLSSTDLKALELLKQNQQRSVKKTKMLNHKCKKLLKLVVMYSC